MIWSVFQVVDNGHQVTLDSSIGTNYSANSQPGRPRLVALYVATDGVGKQEISPSSGQLSILVMRDIRFGALTVFSTADRLSGTGVVNRGDAEGELLADVQAYLRSLSENRRPVVALSEAWNRFYNLYRPIIWQTVRRSGIPDSDLEDCVQEVWIEIVAKLPAFAYDPNRGRFQSWLSVLIRRRVRDSIFRKARCSMENLCDQPAGSLHSPDLSPPALCERRETQQEVCRALAELRNRVSEKNYLALYFRWIEGRGVPHIAEELDLTPEQVRTRHSRGKQQALRLLGSASKRLESRSTIVKVDSAADT